MTDDLTRELVFATVEDMMSDLLYYRRKEDEDLPLGAIEDALRNHVVTMEEILDIVRDALVKGAGEAQ